ncbi:MAG TPA: HlyD family efflux transporter periplasmic adaptor subunit [bacterium]|nr:HlyD family efflux transporter periplasmic adaptor subunit [bacterium]HPT30098.1 HlyD family efflux transporter periplasmic adaptor subunit [bacterium]
MNPNKPKRKKKIWWIVGGAVILIIVGSSFLNKKPKVEYVTTPLKKGSLIQTVSEVGTIKASKELELNFNQSGKLAKILVKGGEMVKQGQLLAELDYSSLVIKEREAASSVAVARANLNKLLAGSTPNEIAIYQAQTNQAQTSYQAALTNYNNLNTESSVDSTPLGQAVRLAELNLVHTRTSGEQAVANQLNNLLITADSKMNTAASALDYIDRILNDSDINSVFSVKNSSYASFTESQYNQAKLLKVEAENAINTARSNSNAANLKAMVDKETAYLNSTQKAASYCFSALENTITSSSLSQAELDAFKTNTNANLSALSTGISALQAADYSYQTAVLSLSNSLASAQEALNQAQVNLSEGIRQAKNSLDAASSSYQVALSQLNKIKTPPRAEDISLSQAQLSQAEANWELVKKQISDNQIVAPIDGQIAKINSEIGEQISPAKPMLTMLTDNNLELEVDISEADIAKIKLQNTVKITLDALGEKQVFNGVIYYIEPSSTVIQEVIYYKIKVKFNDPAEALTEIKPGMTANAIITTAQKDDIFIAPQRGVIAKNGSGNFLRLLVNQKVNEVPVQLGLSGNDGLVEVSGAGLNEGDAVITLIKNAPAN